MSERGVAGTSTLDVQKAAGVGSGQMYHYFAAKEELIRAVIGYQTRLVLDAQHPHLDLLDNLDALLDWRDRMIDFQRRADYHGAPLWALAGELSETSPECRVDLARSFAQWEAAIRRGLQTMYERGDLRRSADPDRLATALLAAFQGGSLLAQVRRSAEPLEAALDEVIDHIASLGPDRRRRF